MQRLWQVTIATRSRETAFRTESERRAVVWRLARMEAPLLLFGLVDDHVHCVLRALGAEASRFAQRLNASVSHLCGVRLAPADIRPVNGRRHLLRLVEYILTQPKKHELPVNCALWAGSCFQDIIGARLVMPRLGTLLSEELPRLRMADVLRFVGLSRDDLVLPNAEDLREAGLGLLASVAVNAACARSFDGRRTEVVLARRLVVHLAREAGLPRRAICAHFRWPARSVDRYGSEPLPPPARRAALMRFALEIATRRHNVVGEHSLSA